MGVMDWIDLAQSRNRWWAVVNAVMNIWIPQNAENLLTTCEPVKFLRNESAP